MAKVSSEILDHLEWIGFIRPTGLVVSAPALVRAGAILNRRDMEGQRLLQASTSDLVVDTGQGEVPFLPDFETFARSVLQWSFSAKGFAGTKDNPIPEELVVPLADFQDTLSPDYAVREFDPPEEALPWQLLVKVLDPGQDLDRVVRPSGSSLEASPHGRLERLLRQTGVPAGVLFNGRVIRLVSAPRGESSGWMDFRLDEMLQTAGRPICSAMRLLLGQPRLLSLPQNQRLAALLDESRKYQNEVSERLAEQVLHALYELLRGFQAAHDASMGQLLKHVLEEHPDQVYRGLLTVLLRLVFLLYAEERDMLPEDEAFLRHYSLAGLYHRLREDAALHPDTMDQRYGAWAQLLVLFRMVFDGAEWGEINLPRRHGVLFDPDRFPFLEGRPEVGARQVKERLEPPLVPDGTVYRALDKLLVLDGERISYRALDVEQIGSVYETMMGFRLEKATGRSIAIRAQKRYGAPTTVDLEALLEEQPSKRKKWLEDAADRKTPAGVGREVKGAGNLEELHAALLPIINQAATPDLVPRGAMVLQPSDERRRSGSHYTPRSLTEPIVRKTLEPLLARLAEGGVGTPRPERILDLKVCDPAMGSGAFLVETCRQLGDALLEAWKAGEGVPDLPPDEDEVVFARRLVAQRCIYGVDRNPVAVDLAKVSLWLVTLARDHAFTFLDHALRRGDSLVGLSRAQLEAFHWDETKPPLLRGLGVRDSLDRVGEIRERIRSAGEEVPDWELRDLWDEGEHELGKARLMGDLVVAAFFKGSTATARERRRGEYEKAALDGAAENHRGFLKGCREADPPLAPFHWALEFPEVFDRENPGFDSFVGNPPFAGKNTTAQANPDGYLNWLKEIHEETHGNSDLVAHFFRRTFDLLRNSGTLGLIATNTIRQGDTRSTGLRWICEHGGEIYDVRKRVRWPGLAAVVVSVIQLQKGPFSGLRTIDGREREVITAFLFHRGGNDDPAPLSENDKRAFVGSYVLGMGFTFDDTDQQGVANSLADMYRLIRQEPSNQEVIFPFLGGSEVSNRPDHTHHRYVINFGERSEKECRQHWPDLMAIVEEKVRPDRQEQSSIVNPDRWWQFARPASELYQRIGDMERVLVTGAAAVTHHAFAQVPSEQVFSHKLIVFALDAFAGFALLQGRTHEIWRRFVGTTRGAADDLTYNPTRVFCTYPFPIAWESNSALEVVGKAYYEFRADLMVRNDEGLTKTYNRFHDPEEQDPEILRFRELHAVMDRAALDAYGWRDIPTDCEFLLDFEIDEEEWGNKKKPWRYRWPDDVHDEVLARLLELNAERAKEEALSGGSTAKDIDESAEVAGTGENTENGDLFE